MQIMDAEGGGGGEGLHKIRRSSRVRQEANKGELRAWHKGVEMEK